jgi:hypothetical protein
LCTLLEIGLFLSRMRGTNVRPKLLVTFRIIPLLYFIDCSANWGPDGLNFHAHSERALNPGIDPD